MKILHVNYYDIKGGAAIAANRLHRGLLTAGIESKMLVASGSNDGTDIIVAGNAGAKFRSRLMLPAIKLLKNEHAIPHSFNFLPNGKILKQINSQDADIVHLHWIGGEMLGIADLPKINKPVVWTFHDCWPMCGSEHYDTFSPDSTVYSAYHNLLYRTADWLGRRLKAHYWKKMDLSITVPSRWMEQMVQNCDFLRHKRIIRIGHGINNQDDFYQEEKSQDESLLHIPEKKFLVLLGSVDLKVVYKIYKIKSLLSELNDIMPGKFFIVAFGNENPDLNKILNGNGCCLGNINSISYLRKLYSAANVFINLSRIESFGLTTLESLACGTPCVAFNIGGIRDVIEHRVNGYLAQPFDIADFAQGVKWVLTQANYNKLCLNARKITEEKFDIRNIVRQYITLYNGILGK